MSEQVVITLITVSGVILAAIVTSILGPIISEKQKAKKNDLKLQNEKKVAEKIAKSAEYNSSIMPSQIVDKPKRKPSNLLMQSADTPLKVRCWETRSWNLYPLQKMKVEAGKDYMTITNSTYIHNHAYVVYDKDLNGDFSAEIELEGEYAKILLADSSGKDRNLHFSPSDQNVDISEPHKIIVSRIGNEIICKTESGYRFFITNWNAEPDMTCYIGISLRNEQTVMVYNWKVKEL